MPDSSVAITPGSGAAIDTFTLPNGDLRQKVVMGNHGGCTARFTTFRIPGRAGTAGQNLAAIWNASSSVNVEVDFVGVDLVQSVVKAVTVYPPIIRLVRLSTIPSSGSAGFKVLEETASPSNSSVTTYQDASAEATSAGTALGFSQTTAAFGITQEWAPRLITAAGYEPADRAEFLTGGNLSSIQLRAGEGLGVRLDYSNASSNPTTDQWLVAMRWEEVT